MPGFPPISQVSPVTAAYYVAPLHPPAQDAAEAAVMFMREVALSCKVPEYLVDGVFCSISRILADDAPQQAFAQLSDPENPVSAFHGSGRPGLDDIVLRGARFLTDRRYPYAIDIMISEVTNVDDGRDNRVDNAVLPHIFLRVHSDQPDQSYIADPMIKFDCALRDQKPVRFETVFMESGEHPYVYDLRQGSTAVKTSICFSLDR
jgi:hypothetical protein